MRIPFLSLLFICFPQLTLSQSQPIDINYAQIIKTLVSVLDKLPSSECTDHFLHFGNALIKGETWALKMVDATAKPQSGIFFGNIMHVGNYDECLEIDVRVNKDLIQGQYCSAFVGPHPKYGSELSQWFEQIISDFERNDDETELAEAAKLSYGFCLPKVCTGENLQNLTNILEDVAESPVHFVFDDKFCDGGDRPEFSSLTIFAIVVFSIFGLLLVCGTMYDVIIYQRLEDTEKQPNLLVAFSVLTNGRKLLSTETAEGNLNCLNGLRVVSMMWIVLAHGFMNTFYIPHVNAQQILTWSNQTENSLVIASPMAVDTFFVISGLLVVYLYMKSQDKGVTFSLPMFYIHRILRLTPSLAMIVLFTATLLKYMGNGPFWPIVEDKFQKPCEKYWWSTLLYVQIYINPDKQCVGQSWYLNVDTQMYFLSPLIFLPLIKWPKQTIGAIIVYIVLNCSYVFEITWKWHLGTNFLNQDRMQYDYLYHPTHVRGIAYLIGMICGYFIYKTRTIRPLQLTKEKASLLWLFSLAVMLAILLGHSSMMSAPQYSALDSSFFNSLIRVGWSIALSIIIIMCVTGYGGLINSFLSTPVFNVLIRLNYSVYLLHNHVLILIGAQGRAPTYFSDLLGFHQFWGDYMFTLGAAVLWTLAFESPVITIERIIFNTKRLSKPKNEINNTTDGEKVVTIQIVSNLRNNTDVVKS